MSVLSVSVVMPCYNAAPFVGAALESLSAQVAPPHEVIVVDDGSTDRTLDVLAACVEPRLRIIRQHNQGPAAARNMGIAAASGDLIALMDADDIALPRRLAVQAATLEAEPRLALVSGGYDWIDEAGRPLPWPYHSWRLYPDLNDLRTWLFDCPIIPSATTLRRSAWMHLGGFDERLIGPEDWDFWMRLVLAGERMAWNRELVCCYRRVSTSISSSARRMAEHSIRALEAIIARPDFPADLVPDAVQALALRYADAAKRLFWVGAWEEGRAALHSALQAAPGLLAGHPCRLEDEIVAAALDPLVADPVAFLDAVLDHLPPEARILADRRGPVLLRCRGELFLRTLARRDPHAWRHLRGMRLHPAWLVDHSLWAGFDRALSNRRKRQTDGW